MANKASSIKATPARQQRPGGKSPSRARWSQRVTRESNVLDLDRGVFCLDDPKKITRSLKRAAERSHRRKAEPYR